MGKYQSSHEEKQRGFRTWKSGKSWLYAASILVALAGVVGVTGASVKADSTPAPVTTSPVSTVRPFTTAPSASPAVTASTPTTDTDKGNVTNNTPTADTSASPEVTVSTPTADTDKASTTQQHVTMATPLQHKLLRATTPETSADAPSASSNLSTIYQATANITGAVSGTNLVISLSSDDGGINEPLTFTDSKSGDYSITLAKNNSSEVSNTTDIIWKDNKTGVTGTATAATDYQTNAVNIVTMRDGAPAALSYKDQTNLDVCDFYYTIGDKFDASKGFGGGTDASGNPIDFSSVKVDTSKVDLKTVGTYPVSYSVVDNTTEKTQTLVANVIVRSDPTLINLTGNNVNTNNNVNINQGATFDASQYLAYVRNLSGDSVDFSQVTVDTSHLNTAKAGVYPVYYSLPDSLITGGKYTAVLNVTVGSPLTGDASTFGVGGATVTEGDTNWAEEGSEKLLGSFWDSTGVSSATGVNSSGTKIILSGQNDKSTATYDSKAVDVNILGTYQVPITVIDPIGNSQTMYATVVVKPHDLLDGVWPDQSIQVSVPIGSNYNPMYGYPIYDDSEQQYTAVTNVNTNQEGYYQTVYAITNNSTGTDSNYKITANVRVYDDNTDGVTEQTAINAPMSSTGTVGQQCVVTDYGGNMNSISVTPSYPGESLSGFLSKYLTVSLTSKPEGSKAIAGIQAAYGDSNYGVMGCFFTPDASGSYTMTYIYTDPVSQKKVSASTVVTVPSTTTGSIDNMSISTNDVTVNQGKGLDFSNIVNSFVGADGKTVSGKDAWIWTGDDKGNIVTGDSENKVWNLTSWDPHAGAGVEDIIIDSSAVDTDKAGTYQIKYTASYDGSSKVLGTSTVTVVARDSQATLEAPKTATTAVNQPYDLTTGLMATDSTGKTINLTSGVSVAVNGKVISGTSYTPNTSGTYKIVYTNGTLSATTELIATDQSSLSAPTHHDMRTGQTYNIFTDVKALNAAGQEFSPTYQLTGQDVNGQSIDMTGLLTSANFVPKVAGIYMVTLTNGTKKATIKIAVAPSQVNSVVDEVTDNTDSAELISSTDRVLIGTVTVKKVGDTFNAYDEYVAGAAVDNNRPATTGVQATMASAIQDLLIKQYPDLATQIKSGYLNSTGILTNLVGVHIISNNVNMKKAGTYFVNYLIDSATMTFTTGDPLPAQIYDLKNMIVMRTVIVEADAVSTPNQNGGQTSKPGGGSTTTNTNSNGKTQVSMLATTYSRAKTITSASMLPITGENKSVSIVEMLLGASFISLTGLFIEMKRRKF